MYMGTAKTVERALKARATPERAKTNAWFFKTGVGQYGEGDRFLGVTVPDARNVAQQFRDLPLDEVATLLASPLHEVRLAGLLILVSQYEHPEKCTSFPVSSHSSKLFYTDDRLYKIVLEKEKKEVVRFYRAHLDRVNNWDLVDLSASQILGAHYVAYGGERALYALAKSKSLWRRRIAIVATYAFIRADRYEHPLAIAELLLNDTHDLIHKATGWMLREVGKRDKHVLEGFLREHAHHMPRTCLRYAIERFPERERKGWLAQ